MSQSFGSIYGTERLVGTSSAGSWDAAGAEAFFLQNDSNLDFVRYALYSNLLLQFVALLQDMNFIAYISVDI